MNWLEVSLTVDGEMAEAVAEVLARFAPNGVVIESTEIAPDPQSEGHPTGPLRVCAYLPMDAQLEETRQRVEESLWHLGRIRPLPSPVFEPIQEVNWSKTWKQHYRPVPIGQRLIIVPAWLESPDERRIPIRIDPGMAFGTGTHPTTQLVLEMLDNYMREFPETSDVSKDLGGLPRLIGADIFDIGCGSGILSIAALKLGAKRAFGVDVEPEAVDAAQKNATVNDVSEGTEFVPGSVEEIKSGVFETKQAPLVLANILAPILIRLLNTGMGDLVAPGGVMILSGILEEQLGQMLAKVEEHGFSVLDRRTIEDWVAIAVTR